MSTGQEITPDHINTSSVSADTEFHIGFTMAGAASAGCYTAGVMDYFFEIMDLWEKARNRQLTSDWSDEIYQYVPTHKVIVDAMGGTSAGGMTTMMSTIYAMNGVVNPVTSTENKAKKKNNILYDSWVLMGDVPDQVNGKQANKKLFEKVFSTDDLEKDGKIKSLLNSKFIDDICDDAFAKLGPQKKLPPYISPDLEVLLSHTMLRGIPLAIDFTTAFGKLHPSPRNPVHYTFDHYTVSHFKINYNPTIDAEYLSMNPGTKEYNLDLLKLVTKATGAFPVGLVYREFDDPGLSVQYLRNTAERNVFKKRSADAPAGVPLMHWPENFPPTFEFASVDGGAVNNEPFGEVLEILKNNHPTLPGTPDKFALIMIDPFPDTFPDRKYEPPMDLFEVAPSIVGALWDQAKVKRAEMLDVYEGKYFLSEIFPRRYPAGAGGHHVKEEDNAIACGAAMAFSGFIDIDFRHHDFFLGRNNARNFFRSYFSYLYDEDKKEMHPIHKSWSQEMREKFKFTRDGKTFLPIIPDLHLLRIKVEKEGDRNPFSHDVQWPQYDAEKLFAMKGIMEKRFKKILELAKDRQPVRAEKDKNPEALRLMKENYRSNIFTKIGGRLISVFVNLIFFVGKRAIASKITKGAIEWIVKDMERQKLLKK